MARRARAGQGGGGRGGAHDNTGAMRWLLTYADLITLLMVFFVVLYSISQVNQSKYIALSQALRASFMMPKDAGNAAIKTSTEPTLDQRSLPKVNAQTGLLESVGKSVMDQAQKQHLQADVTVKVTPEGLRISFHAQQIFFAKARATIRPAFQRLLLSIAPLLRPLPNQIEVQGFTDNEPLSSPIYATSWELSAARAVGVLRFLVDKGGVDPHHVAAVAYGEYHPQYSNATPEGQARNRSVDLLIKPLPSGKAAAGMSP